MPIGVVSDEEFESELSDSPEPRASIELLKVGRGPKAATPKSLRKIIADTAVEEGNGAALELVNQLGGSISQSSISAYKKGATSTATYNQPEEELLGHVNNTRDKIGEQARIACLAAIDEITPDRMGGEKLKDLAVIAKDMAAVSKSMEHGDGVGSDKVVFTFYKVPMKKEEDFPIIDVEN